MELGIHFANFTLPGGRGPGSDPGRHGPGRRGRWLLDLHPDGPLVPDGELGHLAGPDAGGLHLARFPGRPDRDDDPGLLVTGVTYRHPGCWPRSSPPSTSSRADGPNSASARPGTSGSTWASACRSPPSASGSNGWRRHCRSATRCGATTTDPYEGGTTSWRRRSARPGRSSSRARRSSSAAAGSRRPCAWWPATPTPATCSPPIPRWWPTSSRCWPGTARPRAAIPPPSRRRSSGSRSARPTSTPSCRHGGLRQARGGSGRGHAAQSRPGGLGPAGHRTGRPPSAGSVAIDAEEWAHSRPTVGGIPPLVREGSRRLRSVRRPGRQRGAPGPSSG